MFSPVQRINNDLRNLSLIGEIELLGYHIPLILNYLLSFSLRAFLHDVIMLFISLSVIYGNTVVELIANVVEDPRPEPYADFGMPAREPQTIALLISFYCVFVYWWPQVFSFTTSLYLFLAVVWSSIVYVSGDHYTVTQVVVGYIVGIVNGVSSALLYLEFISPLLPSYLSTVNAYLPHFLHLSNAFHYHPGRKCELDLCSGYEIVDVRSDKITAEIGYSHLGGTIFKLLVPSLFVALIHI